MPKSLFVAVGQDGLRTVSADGEKWTNKQTGKEGEVYRAAAVGNGVCVAVGSFGGENIMAASSDGIAWKTAKHEAKYVQYIRGLTFGNGVFLGLGGDPGEVGSSKPFVFFSRDGLVWNELTAIPGKHILRRAIWGDGRFVGVGDRGRRAVSTDGKTWEDAAAVKPIDTLIDIAFGNGIFVGVGLHGLRMSSKDGLKWSDPLRGDEGEHLNSVVFAKDRFVAVGAGATFTSIDGIKWDRTPNENAPQVSTYGAGIFVGASWKGRLLVSADAVKWREVFKGDQHIQAVAWGEVSAS